MSEPQPDACFLCGSHRMVARRYLRLDSLSRVRNAAYALPVFIGRLLSAISNRFAAAYRPVIVNRRYFDKHAVYCLTCCTGRAVPAFTEAELSGYYRDFYWRNRDVADGQHISDLDRPNDRQLATTRDRLAWIGRFVGRFDSAIDFGAGDCAATYEMLAGASTVHVVDPSDRARELALHYGATYSAGLDEAPKVDLFYSAHSIEHVAEFEPTLKAILRQTKVGGYVFFETPNIADAAVFKGLGHTPHTYMLSEKSFANLQALPVRVVAIEMCGPEWRISHPRIKSTARADLRVLLQKVSETSPEQTA